MHAATAAAAVADTLHVADTVHAAVGMYQEAWQGWIVEGNPPVPLMEAATSELLHEQADA